MMEGMKWLRMGLAAMFTLIGLAIFLGVIYSIINGTFTTIFFQQYGVWNLVGLVFVVWLITWIFRMPYRMSYRHDRWRWRENAQDIIKRRYASGEITKTQFESMMKDLKKHESMERE